MENIFKRGISLIVLIITIIVVIVIAGVVILSLQKNNPLSMARKAKFVQNVDTFKNELELYKQNEYLKENMSFDPNSLQANVSLLKENGKTIENKNIYDVISALKNVGYKDDTFVVVDGKLVYKGTVKEEQDWSKDEGITIDNGSVNIVLTAKQDMTIPYKQGKLIQYNLKIYSDQGLKEISKDTLKNGIKIIDKNEKELTIQPNIDINDISGTENEKDTVITVNTTGITDGKYTVKINKDLVENNANKLNDEISSSEFFEIDNTAPESPVITPSTTKPVQQETVTIIYSDDSDKKQYSYDGTTWSDYTEELTITDNCVVYARGIDKAGNISGQSTLSINNIDKVAPVAPTITPNSTSWTNQNVTVVITYPSDANSKQYSYDGTNWSNYTGDISIANNCVIYARGIDEAGNISSQATCNINNIDKTSPNNANITSNINETNISGNIYISDSQSGININKSRYILTQNSSIYSVNDNVWNTASTFSSQNQAYNLSVQTSGTYYVQVLSADNANNEIVNISSAIVITNGLVGNFTFNNNTIQNSVNGKIYTGTGTSFESGISGSALKIDNGGQVNIPLKDLGIDDDNTQQVTVSFWFKWNGEDNIIPLGFNNYYNMWIVSNYFGFNTAQGDLYGINNPLIKGSFINITLIFNKGDYTKNSMYINGIKQNLSQKIAAQGYLSEYFKNDLCISGREDSTIYRYNGSAIDELKIYNRALTDTEISKISQ